jgi:Amt family ammonium transporter
MTMLTLVLHASPTDINTGDTAWVLTSAALVLLMTPGLAFFYGGLVRSKNMLNTLMMSFVALGLIAIEWAMCGYSFSFAEGNAWLGGTGYFGLQGVGLDAYPGTAIPHQAFMVFQMMFAIITPALISGAVVGRMKFKAYVIFIVLWALAVYNPLCHWVWGGGWLQEAGALDFAGGTVVHISAGVSALVAAMILGPRYKHKSAEMAPHHVPFVMLGAGLLWFGWFGFNAGSALGAGAGATAAFVTTNLAAAAALVTWLVIETLRCGKATAVGAATGAVVGLVTITPAAGFVTPMGAMAMGAMGASVSFLVIQVFSKFSVDDSLDVFACHGMGGITGALLTGVFASEAVGGSNGLLYGNAGLMWPQLQGVLAAAGLAGLATAIILYGLKFTIGLRSTEDDERFGLDVTEHAEEAYRR